ncbi:MAG: hypothetical protein N2Z72_04115 [Bacteroidales bacterium]|nr:hypothetical protein [Bacteroidales bacterium]
MKELYVFFAIFILYFIKGQNVGISETMITPHASAMLEIRSSGKGVLIPRVSLNSTTSPSPISSPATSLLVFNTAMVNDVQPGYYYWDGNKWVLLISSSSAGNYAWLLAGNAGIVPGTHFLGTTDLKEVIFKTANNEIMRLTTDGKVGIGTTTVNGKLDVRTNNLGDAIYVESSQFAGNGIQVYVNASGITYGVWGKVNSTTNSSKALYGQNLATSGVVFGVDGRTYSNDGHAIRGYNSSTTAPTNPNSPSTAVYGQNDAPQSITIWGVSNNNTTSQSFAIWGETRGSKSIGVVGVGNGISALNIPSDGCGGYFTGTSTGTFSYATNTSGDRQAYYAMWRNNVGTTRMAQIGGFIGGTEYKITGNGAAGTIVKDLNQQERIMFCPEAPQVVFHDMGRGKLKNGRAYVKLDEIFSYNVIIDDQHPANVFIQPLGPCNGMYVTNITQEGFEVVEQMNGTSNVEFSWFIIAVRKDEVENGRIVSRYQDLRFPYAPPHLKGINIQHQLPPNIEEKK